MSINYSFGSRQFRYQVRCTHALDGPIGVFGGGTECSIYISF